ncbi:MAG: hypothetical protein QOJ46_890 [bacterium]|jgi:hypothetical protein
MGLLDGIFDQLFVGARKDRGLERLAADGELVPATIYAIRVVGNADGDEWTYGLDMVTSAGPLRASVRQMLIPDAWRAPLGARVLARHLDGRVAIDWRATLSEAGIESQTGLLAGKTLSTTLEPGIDDDRISRKQLAEGRRVRALVVASEPVEVLGMPTQNRRLTLRIEDPRSPRTAVLAREQVPPYAAALAVAGTRLPIAIHPQRPDRITIDWPAAAEAAAAR